jgi:hypothetical protein
VSDYSVQAREDLVSDEVEPEVTVSRKPVLDLVSALSRPEIKSVQEEGSGPRRHAKLP